MRTSSLAGRLPSSMAGAATRLAALRDVGYVVARETLAPVAVEELRAAFRPATLGHLDVGKIVGDFRRLAEP